MKAEKKWTYHFKIAAIKEKNYARRWKIKTVFMRF